MRIDRRQPDELRPITITPNYLRHAEGSVLLEWGKNKILCATTLETRVPPHVAGTGSGWVTAEYAMLPRSSKQRVPRESSRSNPNGRSIEIQRLIGRSLRAITDLKAFGERSMILDCDVIESDGGTRTACITGAFVAFALAIKRLRDDGQIAQGAKILKDYLAAVSVGIVEGRPALDLTYLEDSQAEVDMNVVMTGSGRFVELQGTAEHEPFTREQHEEMLAYARRGIDRIVEIQKSIVQIEPAPVEKR